MDSEAVPTSSDPIIVGIRKNNACDIDLQSILDGDYKKAVVNHQIQAYEFIPPKYRHGKRINSELLMKRNMFLTNLEDRMKDLWKEGNKKRSQLFRIFLHNPYLSRHEKFYWHIYYSIYFCSVYPPWMLRSNCPAFPDGSGDDEDGWIWCVFFVIFWALYFASYILLVLGLIVSILLATVAWLLCLIVDTSHKRGSPEELEWLREKLSNAEHLDSKSIDKAIAEGMESIRISFREAYMKDMCHASVYQEGNNTNFIMIVDFDENQPVEALAIREARIIRPV